MCFSPPIRNDPKKKHINIFWPPAQFRDNPPNLFMFMCFSFPDIREKRLISLREKRARRTIK